MKRTNTSLFLVATALLTLSLTFSACDKKTSPAGESTKTITFSVGNDKDSTHIDITLPILPDPKAHAALMEQVSEVLGGTYKGDYADVDSFARQYAQERMAEMAEIHTEMDGDYDEDMAFMMQYERSLQITKGYETDRLVTINLQTYDYNGGAHGITISWGMTFRKSDGRQMGSNVLNNNVSDEGWTQLMHKGLMEYFEVETEEELGECLFNSDLFELALPHTEPSFGEEGLVFTYQQYEIAAYAYGMPSFTIPYDKLTKYLNTTGLRLMNIKE